MILQKFLLYLLIEKNWITVKELFTIPIVNASDRFLHKKNQPTFNYTYTKILADKFRAKKFEVTRIPVYTRIGLIIF